MDTITLSLCGQGAGGLTEELDSAGVKYKTFERKPGMVYAAAGDILNIAQDVGFYGAIAGVLIAWVRAKANRSIVIVTKQHKVVHAKGYSVADFQQLLHDTRRIDAIDPSKPEQIEHDR